MRSTQSLPVFTLDEDEVRRIRHQRRVFLNTRRIPLMRLIGLALICVGVYFHNRYLTDTFHAPSFAAFGVTLIAYALLSGALLRLYYDRLRSIDLGFVFLVIDVVFFVAAIYLTGAERSPAFFILMMRVVDQVLAGLGRAVLFAGLTVLAYVGMIAWILLVDGRDPDWLQAVTRIVILILANAYIVYGAWPATRLQQRTSQAIGTARRLIQRLRAQSRELKAARDRAQQASAAKSEFLANMSHEIRTPMSAVIGLLDRLLDSRLEPEQQSWARTARRSADTLLQILGDVLDISKIESGSLELDQLPVDPRVVIDDVAALFEQASHDRGLALERRIDPRTPRAVIGDPVRLRQILVNLVANAVKFTERGRITLRIEVEALEESAARLRFSVVDTGIGIARDEQQRIFETFRQLDGSTTRRHSGSGLGLAICKRLVEAMGGELGVVSRPGVGSRFFFRLRLPLVTATDDGAEAETSEQAPALPAGGGQRILVAEDSDVNRMILRHQLERLGYAVTTARDGQEALEMLAEGPQDAVLMDCQMPRMDGFEATRRLRQLEQPGRRIPVIAVTAHARREDRDRCLAAGMDDHLAKPVAPERLASTIARWLAGDAQDVENSIVDPSSDKTDGDEILDPRAVARLRELDDGGDGFLSQVVELYLRNVPSHLEAIAGAFEAGDLDALARHAHILKGSAGEIGARRVQCLADELSNREAIEDAASSLERLRNAHAETERALNELIAIR